MAPMGFEPTTPGSLRACANLVVFTMRKSPVLCQAELRSREKINRIAFKKCFIDDKMKKIIGIIGPKLAGKNTAAEYILDRLEIPFYTISDTLKEMAALRNLPQTRDNLIILGNELATEKGEEYLSKEILEKIRYAGIIVGMRQISKS